MSDRLAVVPQYLLPKQALTMLAGQFASAQLGGLTTWVIRQFVNHYNVNMAEAAQPDVASYASFNDFFTRALQPGARPLAGADLVCPVDGAISQFGPIVKDQVFQAKGHSYSTTALVGGDATAAARFDDGYFATLYLSPRDYHRIHMPCAGTLTRMVYVRAICIRSIRSRRKTFRACSPATSAWFATSTPPTARWLWSLLLPPSWAAWSRFGMAA